MNKGDLGGLNKAADLAARSSAKCRVGACIEAGGSWNQDKTHPAIRKHGYPEHCNLHAELALALAFNHDGLQGETVYVARIRKDGVWAMAKPCVNCMQVLVSYDVKRVVWTTGPDMADSIRF